MNAFLHRGCWFCYELRRTSKLLSSVVDANVLRLEHTRAQYIYIDDPRLQGEINHTLIGSMICDFFNCFFFPHAIQWLSILSVYLIDVLLHRGEEDLNSPISEEKPDLKDSVITWWKSLNRILAYRFLHVAQNGSLIDRQKAVYSLSYLKHLKGISGAQRIHPLPLQTS